MKEHLKIGCFGLLLFMISGCMGDMKIDSDPDQPMPMAATENIEFKHSWKRWDKPNSMRLYDYRLTEMEDINGVPCINSFTLDSIGELYGFVLGKDFELNGAMLPKGSRYEARLGRADQRIGYMIFLPKPYDIQGFHVRDEAGLENYKVDFYLDGRLRDFKVFEDLEIDGVLCKGGKNSGISLYPNGKLWICHLSEDMKVKGEVFTESTKVIIDTSGNFHNYTTDLHLEIMQEIGIF